MRVSRVGRVWLLAAMTLYAVAMMTIGALIWEGVAS